MVFIVEILFQLPAPETKPPSEEEIGDIFDANSDPIEINADSESSDSDDEESIDNTQEMVIEIISRQWIRQSK